MTCNALAWFRADGVECKLELLSLVFDDDDDDDGMIQLKCMHSHLHLLI